MKLENFKVTMHTNELFFATWNAEGARFHVWLDNAGELVNGTLYKNPPLEIPFEGEGWFETRYLKAHNKSNRPIIDEIKKRIAEGNLIGRARLEKDAADFVRQREDEARKVRAYREALVAASLALGKGATETERHFGLYLAHQVNSLSNDAVKAFAETFLSETKARGQ
ncbi:hypothetical protein ACVIRO_001062 [Rhizobium ruizarguesonis]